MVEVVVIIFVCGGFKCIFCKNICDFVGKLVIVWLIEVVLVLG